MAAETDPARRRSRAFVAAFVVVVAVLAAAAIYINIANPFGLKRAAQGDEQAQGEQVQGALEQLIIETSAGPRSFKVEIARTPEQKSKGLMFRQSMPTDQGMLFLHDQDAERMMWMRNTYLALDMLFIKADGRIHRIAERTQPFSEATVASQGPVRAVLELNAGRASASGIKVGDLVRHGHFGTVQ
jgi:uncharacterized protein